MKLRGFLIIRVLKVTRKSFHGVFIMALQSDSLTCGKFKMQWDNKVDNIGNTNY